MISITNRKRSLASEFAAFRAEGQLTTSYVREYLQSIDTPRSLTIWLLFSSYAPEDHDQLTTMSIDPLGYVNYLSGYPVFQDDYLATCFLSKSSFLKTTFDKKEKALEKFRLMETACGSTNQRFSNLSLDPSFNGSNCWLLNATCRKIESILGSFVAEEFFSSAGWGPGVTTKLKGDHVSAINKFHLENEITQNLYSLVGDLFPVAYPIWGSHLSHLYGEEGMFSISDGNSIITVPKTSKIDRVIAVEPGVNLWFQKGIGQMIRKRLRRVGIDLNDQSRNQQLSRPSSRDGGLATVDFSSASDSIALGVVRELFPPRWLALLESCRCRNGVLDGARLTWNKFSSMGNGFTFELESLIFYAAAYATCEMLGLDTSDVSVFGDDVIIPTDAYKLFHSFCAFLGFTVNSDKSFYSGHFRESCGAHFWDGADVKPIYLKDKIRTAFDVFKSANAVRKLAHRSCCYMGCDSRFLRPWQVLYKSLPTRFRVRGDLSLGDMCFSCNFDEATPTRARDGLEGHLVKTFMQIPIYGFLDSPAVLMARLWYSSDFEENNSFPRRGRVKVRLTTVLVPRWYNFGRWV